MGSLVDRLAAHLRSTPGAERPIAGRVGGALWLIAGLATAVLPLFPQATQPLFPWIALFSAGAVGWGVCCIAVFNWERMPGWVIPVANAVAVLFTGVVTELTGRTESPARLYTILALV
jgi:hypothetical protein